MTVILKLPVNYFYNRSLPSPPEFAKLEKVERKDVISGKFKSTFLFSGDSV